MEEMNEKKTTSKSTPKKTSTKKTLVEKTDTVSEVKEEEVKSLEDKEVKKDFADSARDAIDAIMDTDDTTNKYDKKDIQTNKPMAVLSYIGPLVLIPFLVEKNSEFVKYHAKQGMNLFIIDIIVGFVGGILTSLIKVDKYCKLFDSYSFVCGKATPWWVSLPVGILGLGIFILCIIGIVYVCEGKAKELPIVNKVKFFK